MAGELKPLNLFRDRINLRTKWGKIAWQTIQDYYKRKSPRLGLLKDLIAYYPEKSLNDILNVKPVDYQTNVKTQCICGKSLSKEMYRMRLKGHVTKESPAYQIDEKIKAKKPYRKRVEEFTLGSECYKNLPDLLSDFGYRELRRQIRERKARNEKTISEIVNGFSEETRKLLSQRGINVEQLVKLSYLTKNLELEGLESRLLYDLDPGKKNSFANWFREGIKKKTIGDKEIKRIYNSLEKAPQLLEEKDLAKLVAYQYDYRKFDSRAVLGNIKKDLLYMDSLDENNEIIKRYGKPNLDKHFIRPATIFRKRKGLENVTIREKISQPYLTFIEALGIKNHFPAIEKTRVDTNRNVADRYGVGRTWDYLLEKLSKQFFDVKAELAEEYRQFGGIVREKVMTRDEYSLLKGFFKRANILENERESYLAFYSMPSFAEIAPRIVVIERKIKLAERFGKETLKKNFLLREEVENDAMDMIENSYFNNRMFRKFKEKSFGEIKEFYNEGLIEKNALKNNIAKWHGLLKESKVKKFDAETEQAKAYLNSLKVRGLIEASEEFERLFGSKYAHENYSNIIIKAAKGIKEGLGLLEGIKEESYRKEMEKLNELRSSYVIKKYVNDEIEILPYNPRYHPKSISFYEYIGKNGKFTINVFHPKHIEECIGEIGEYYVNVSKEHLEKINNLIRNKKLKIVNDWRDGFKKFAKGYKEIKAGHSAFLEKEFAEELKANY